MRGEKFLLVGDHKCGLIRNDNREEKRCWAEKIDQTNVDMCHAVIPRLVR
jgi:hypothetical protein